ncbi:10619_t:CDS:2, partial [Gigaspora rosea]
ECWAHAFTKHKFSANTHSTQRAKSINHIMKLEVNSGNSLCQLQTGIELWLKDEVKYAKFQEFRNINPTTGLPHVSNTIFKQVDNIYKKLKVNSSQQLDYRAGFIEDNYKELQILLDMALEDCS